MFRRTITFCLFFFVQSPSDLKPANASIRVKDTSVSVTGLNVFAVSTTLSFDGGSYVPNIEKIVVWFCCCVFFVCGNCGYSTRDCFLRVAEFAMVISQVLRISSAP